MDYKKILGIDPSQAFIIPKISSETKKVPKNKIIESLRCAISVMEINLTLLKGYLKELEDNA